MNKYKKLAFNTVIFAVGSFGSKILALLLTNLYTKYIDYGQMNTKNLLESAALFLIPIFTFALQEYMIRFGLDKGYDKREIFSTSACMTAMGLAAMALVVPLLKLIPFLDFIAGYTVLLIVYVCTSSLRMLCQQFVRAREMVKLFSLDGIFATLTFVIFNFIFIGGLGWGVKGFMVSMILSDFLSAAFLFIVAGLHKFLGIQYWSKELAKTMLAFSLPLVPTIVMWTSTSLSDQLFVRCMHSDRAWLGEEAAGIYGVATRIPNLISMISTIFFQAWNMSAIMENESEDRSSFYEKVYSAYEAILFIASAGLIFLVKPVSSILVNTSNYSEYETVYLYTPVLVVSALFLCLDQFLGGIYSATKNTRNSFWTSLITCGLNLFLNFTLIPEWGIQGAAIATFLSYFLCFWIRIIDARYYVPFRFNGGKSLLNTGVLLVMCWLMISSPKLSLMWAALLLCFIMWSNYQAVIDTAKKILKRG